MGKLIFAVMMALLLPLLYAVAARAEQPRSVATAHKSMMGTDHYKAWTQTVDEGSLSPAESQRLRIRQTMNDDIGQMRDIYRMMSSQSRHLQTAGGLVSAGEQVLDQASQTTDYYSLENYSQRLRSLRLGIQALHRL